MHAERGGNEKGGTACLVKPERPHQRTKGETNLGVPRATVQLVRIGLLLRQGCVEMGFWPAQVVANCWLSHDEHLEAAPSSPP